MKTYEVVWEEWNRAGTLVQKRKEFKTDDALQRFITNLVEKDSFQRVIAYGSDN